MQWRPLQPVLEVNVDAPPVRYTVRWANERDSESSPESETEDFERDGRTIPMPRYDDDRRDDDVVEGELASPAQMIEHEAAAVAQGASQSRPSSSAPPPAPEFAAVRYERERIDAWIRNRLIAYPLASCFGCRKPIVAGRRGRKFRTARRERAFIGLVTPNGALSGKRRRGRRWGSRAEPFRSERSRRMRGANEPPFTGLKELLRPAIVHRGDALAAAEFGYALLPAQPFQYDADLSFS